MNKEIIIAAQIRAARALLAWSQEELATKAEVGVSTIRDIEVGRRSSETKAMDTIQRTLENEGVVFLAGSAERGPGVALVADRPHIIRPPTVMTMWDGMPFTVEWRGTSIDVFIAREVLDDLGRLTTNVTDEVYRKIFETHRGAILDDVARALKAGKADSKGRLRLVGDDIRLLQ